MQMTTGDYHDTTGRRTLAMMPVPPLFLLYCLVSVIICGDGALIPQRTCRRRLPTNVQAKSGGEATEGSLSEKQSSDFLEPSDSRFGRRDYWDDMYRQADGEAFSWYTEWSDLEPFVQELIPDSSSGILIPGIGNDGAIVGMYDAGYHNLTAFDYAPEGVVCAKKLFGPERQDVKFLVADARNLHFDNGDFDAALDKGTLDAIYLSGGHDKELAAKHLEMAVSELARVIRPGGVMVSVTAACVSAVQAAFEKEPETWRTLRDGSFHVTEDGYASNSVDGTLLAWERIDGT